MLLALLATPQPGLRARTRASWGCLPPIQTRRCDWSGSRTWSGRVAPEWGAARLATRGRSWNMRAEPLLQLSASWSPQEQLWDPSALFFLTVDCTCLKLADTVKAVGNAGHREGDWAHPQNEHVCVLCATAGLDMLISDIHMRTCTHTHAHAHSQLPFTESVSQGTPAQPWRVSRSLSPRTCSWRA